MPVFISPGHGYWLFIKQFNNLRYLVRTTQFSLSAVWTIWGWELRFMDFAGESEFVGGTVGLTAANEVSGGGGFDNWAMGSTDLVMWATNDEYRAWEMDPPSETLSDSNYSGGQSQSRSGLEPPSKKTRNSQTVDSQASNRSKAIGKMFYKTKLCCKFRAGVCPYITNCNFAHGIEELRKPPPNWQEIVAAHEGGDRGGFPVEQREEHQIPTISSPELRGESQRSYKGRHCKKFYTEEGCPYGENCTFLHDEHSRARESVAISVTPTAGSGYTSGNNGNGSSQKPSNWKTRICNKWETTGYCPFGSKCHFAHGMEELHKYGGLVSESEGKDSSSAPSEPKQAGASLRGADAVVASSFSGSPADVYNSGMGAPPQRLSGAAQVPNQRLHQKWKGPDKISRIYGDWIDDIE